MSLTSQEGSTGHLPRHQNDASDSRTGLFKGGNVLSLMLGVPSRGGDLVRLPARSARRSRGGPQHQPIPSRKCPSRALDGGPIPGAPFRVPARSPRRARGGPQRQPIPSRNSAVRPARLHTHPTRSRPVRPPVVISQGRTTFHPDGTVPAPCCPEAVRTARRATIAPARAGVRLAAIPG